MTLLPAWVVGLCMNRATEARGVEQLWFYIIVWSQAYNKLATAGSKANLWG